MHQNSTRGAAGSVDLGRGPCSVLSHAPDILHVRSSRWQQPRNKRASRVRTRSRTGPRSKPIRTRRSIVRKAPAGAPPPAHVLHEFFRKGLVYLQGSQPRVATARTDKKFRQNNWVLRHALSSQGKNRQPGYHRRMLNSMGKPAKLCQTG